MKILIVEDEDMIREGISDYLTDCGYETIQAADGLEALEKFSNHQSCLGSLRYPNAETQWFRGFVRNP